MSDLNDILSAVDAFAEAPTKPASRPDPLRPILDRARQLVEAGAGLRMQWDMTGEAHALYCLTAVLLEIRDELRAQR